ncbi:hypothetical protein FS749_010954 [Ceratobasidium sp. UAMH 11750]|nr:hypothetical protein FS749_010954 [Ceratobasidium sp. UAMH 11750]
MPPGSKRSTADRPKTFLREGEKRIKYRSLGFSGVRQRFTSRPAAVISHDPTPGSARPDFSFDPRVTPGPTAEAWVAPQEVVEPARSSEELELDLDPSDELDQVLLDHGTTQSGKGQNEMMNDWLDVYGTSYLRHLYRQYEPPELGELCMCGGTLPPSFLCRDCVAHPFECKTCILVHHKRQPSHRIREWAGSSLKSTTLLELGLQLPLGNHRDPCPIGHSRVIVLGDTNGFHRVNVTFCRCNTTRERSPSDYQQLLDARIFPCSDERPVSGFTFSVLKSFHIAATECKMSGGRFYALLSRLTRSSSTNAVPNRYREFMRVSRAWMWLQTKKRAGSFNAARGEDLALRCPACPRVGVNYIASDVSAVNWQA